MKTSKKLSDNDLYWLWLSTKCGAGSRSCDILTDIFGYKPNVIYKAGKNDYEEHADRIKPELIKSLCDKSMELPNKIVDYCYRRGIEILTPDNPLYPKRLLHIKTFPAALYYKGIMPQPDIENNVCVAVVGTRRMSEYGKRAAYTISYDLSRSGAVVVSGLASGIDSVCHRAAMDAGGLTIAVLGCGIDKAYPPENEKLMEEITKKGLVMTEFRPFTNPVGTNFPIRNRIISGLSHGTLVVEADNKSGALITARTASNQGRDIFALPGKIGEQNSLGTNKLIQDGAVMVTSAADILKIYSDIYPDKIIISTTRNNTEKQPSYINIKPKREIIDVEKDFIVTPPEPKRIRLVENEISEKVLKSFGKDPLTTDELSHISGVDIADVMITLTELEISGRIKSVAGGKFLRLT